MNPMVSATNNLRIGLTILQVLTGFSAVLGLLGLFTQSQQFLQDPGNQNSSVGSLPLFVIALVDLLIIVLSVAYIFIIGWIKEWQARVSGWSQGQNLDQVRLERLSDTLGKWIMGSQWGPIIAVGLVLLLFTVGGAIFGALLGSIGSSNGSSGSSGSLNSLAGAGIFGGILAFVVLLVGAPVIVLNWLVLKSIKTWLLEVTNRAVGRPASTNLLTLSNGVSSWLVFSQVMVCTLAVFTLLSLLRGSTGAGTVSPVTLALSIGGEVLNFMLLQWSKTFMFGVAGYAERYGSSAVDLSKV